MFDKVLDALEKTSRRRAIDEAMDDRGEGETRADVARRLGVPIDDPTVVNRDDPDWGWSEDDPGKDTGESSP